MERPIDEYRQPWESAEHWELRRAFIEANRDKVGEARLLSLSHACVNMVLLDCEYPFAVTAQVAVLLKNVTAMPELLEKLHKRRDVLIPKEIKGGATKKPRFPPLTLM
ncbi:hypothetical protein V5799_008257 [Amblyomma americanum]|uniref:XRN2-binding (XTBD) domain-containing protein n=1 Tax=Amblyomma americanum TaxID=6943 RepID=A0AAQ4FFE6_AMBAM